MDTSTATTVDRRKWWTLAVLNLSLLMTIMDNTILNVALPTLARELGASGSQLQWMVDSYVLVFAALLLPAGALGDRFGRRGAFNIGLVVFGFGSLAATFANSANTLIATRSMMGIGAALIMPATLSILTDVFTDPKERATAIGSWAMVGGVGVALGPIMGGWLLEHFSWSSIFMINLPVVVAVLIGSVVFVPTSRDPEAPRLDLVGAGLSVVALGSLVWAIIKGGEHGWTATGTLIGFSIAGVTAITFARWEQRVEQPMLDLSFFRNRRFTAASLSVMLGYFSLFGTLFLLGQLLQFVLGYDALGAGVRLLPFALAMVIGSPISVQLVHRVGTKVVVTSGLTMVAGGLLWLAEREAGDTYSSYLPGMVVMGIGVALTWAPTTEAIMGSLPPAKAGIGSAINDTVREVGGALGVAVLGSLVAFRYDAGMTDATTNLPDAVRDTARESLGGSLGVADRLGGTPGQALAAAGRASFIDGFGLAVTVAACVAFAGAVLAAMWLPARIGEHATGETADPAVDDADTIDLMEPVPA